MKSEKSSKYGLYIHICTDTRYILKDPLSSRLVNMGGRKKAQAYSDVMNLEQNRKN